MKVIRMRNHITVILNDNTMLTNSNCTDEMYNEIIENQDSDETVSALLVPEFYKKKEETAIMEKLLNDFNSSEYLTVKGSSVYLEEVSELSLPEDLALAIFKAEQEENTDLILTYMNFWTLASLNPDSRARTNLFWFLKKYGMTISRSGLFIAYRNVNIKEEGNSISAKFAKAISKLYVKVKFKWKKSPKNYFVVHDGKDYGLMTPDEVVPDGVSELGNLQKLYMTLSNEKEAPTYTDGYTGKFTIKIGEPVTMPREKCDPIQENTCSRGLHVAGKDWLQSNYFGSESLIVLVNPADVVAVPPSDSYGKMRTCAYYPVALVERDKEGNIVNDDIPSGFEDDFIDRILYQGQINNEDENPYRLEVPNIPELNRELIYGRLEEIQMVIKSKYNAN